MAGARLQSVDVYRGLALVAMAAYHACWDLNYYGLITVGIGEDPVWISAQRTILTAFLLLAGAGLTLGHSEGIRWRAFWRREAVLITAAVVVSLGTWFLFQDGKDCTRTAQSFLGPLGAAGTGKQIEIFKAFLCNFGLRRSDGTPKPAWKEFEARRR